MVMVLGGVCATVVEVTGGEGSRDWGRGKHGGSGVCVCLSALGR